MSWHDPAPARPRTGEFVSVACCRGSGRRLRLMITIGRPVADRIGLTDGSWIHVQFGRLGDEGLMRIVGADGDRTSSRRLRGNSTPGKSLRVEIGAHATQARSPRRAERVKHRYDEKDNAVVFVLPAWARLAEGAEL